MKTLEELAQEYVHENFFQDTIWRQETQDAFIAGAQAAQKAAEVEIKDKVIGLIQVTIVAMILDGYDEYDTCVKYVKELIDKVNSIAIERI